MNGLLPFGPFAWAFIALYLSSLLLVGYISFKARRTNTLHDFYVAGSGFGFFVLLMTLYATQYSGNTLFGFSGATYRIGFPWILSVHSIAAIVMFLLAYALRLHRLSKQHGFVTPVDFIAFRYSHKPLALLASIVMIVVLCNYLLAQLMAMGRALQGLAGESGDIAYNWGVVVLALIIVVYGTLGGLRAVAWTDLIQGTVLMLGFLLLLLLLYVQFGSIGDATREIISRGEVAKVAPPDASRMREWVSYVLLIGMGGALYPQAIQRVYAAGSESTLRKSMAVMAFLPFVSIFVSVLAGIYALAYVSGLSGVSSDQALTALFREVQQHSLLGYALVVLIFSAVLAAIMSTADSAMLSISSMFTKDIYGEYFEPAADEARLSFVGKVCSWVLITLLVMLAILLKDKASLVSLIDRKFDLLVQLVPAFMLGVHSNYLKPKPVFLGLVFGVITALVLAFGPFDFVDGGKIYGFHPGLYGLGLNLLICLSGSARRRLV
ncbi:MAG: sodium:solute symporter family protein [Pseudomonadota bacterium]